MILPTIKNFWFSETNNLVFLELLVRDRFEILAWIPSGYVANTEI